MANLLPRDDRPRPFDLMDPVRCCRLVARLRTLLALRAGLAAKGRGLASALGAALDRLEPAIEELEAGEATVAVLESLLDEIDHARAGDRRAIASVPSEAAAAAAEGDWLCWWPGRSLATGEAEVASRGFFDGADRPPIACWLISIARPAEHRPDAFELAVVAWVPPEDLARAYAGTEACRSGALERLASAAPEVARQLTEILASEGGSESLSR